MKPRDVLLCLLTMFLWGAQVTAVKIADQELPPFFMLLFRFTVIAACLLPFARRPQAGQAGRMALVALFSTVMHFGLLYLGIGLVPASTSALIYQLSPVFSLLLAAGLLGDQITLSSGTGVLLSLLGVALLFGGFHPGSGSLGGALVALAALSFAIGNLLIKKLGPFDPVTLNAWSALYAIPVMLALSLSTEHWTLASLMKTTLPALLALVYAAVSGGIIGFAIWYRLINSYPISRLAPFTLLVPLFAVAVSQAVLHEQLTVQLMMAAGLIISGVAISQFQLFRLLSRAWLRVRA